MSDELGRGQERRRPMLVNGVPDVAEPLDKMDRWSTNSILLSKVQSEPMEWLWPGRIPLGVLTVLDGDPGLGKSLVALDLAARVSTGAAMPDGSEGRGYGLPADVILLCAEDDLAHVVRPRLHAAGANLGNIRAVTCALGVDRDDDYSPRKLLLPRDMESVRDAVEESCAALIIIDPLMAYLEPRVNSWRDQDVRHALAPLGELAREGNLAVLIVRHLNKAAGGSALYRGGGSIGIIGTARAGLVIGKSPDDPEHERVLASSKSNLGPPMPALRYRLKPLTDDPFSQYVQVEWCGTCAYSADALLNQAPPSAAPLLIDEAMTFLREALAEGPRPATEVEREGTEQGISPRTLKRARARLGVRVIREGFGGGGRWCWALASNDDDTDAGTESADTTGAAT